VCSIHAVQPSPATHERRFEQWVCGRLARWPTLRILQLEHWLREREEYELIPAVRETLRLRGIEPGDICVRDATLADPQRA
jgi:hypothetical protein